LVDRILFPIETNRAAGSSPSFLESAVALSSDGRVARMVSYGAVVRSDDLGTIWYRETSLPATNQDSRLMAVAQSSDGRRAIAVGEGGLPGASPCAAMMAGKPGVSWQRCRSAT
jgi:hypothetical protein